MSVLRLFSFNENTADEWRISDVSSDVCSSDRPELDGLDTACVHLLVRDADGALIAYLRLLPPDLKSSRPIIGRLLVAESWRGRGIARALAQAGIRGCQQRYPEQDIQIGAQQSSEEHTSELQSLMRMSYAVFCLKK